MYLQVVEVIQLGAASSSTVATEGMTLIFHTTHSSVISGVIRQGRFALVFHSGTLRQIRPSEAMKY